MRRAGTEVPALAYAFAEALEWNLLRQAELQERQVLWKAKIINELRAIDGFFLSAEEVPQLPNTLNFGVRGVSAESLLISLDLDQICVSTSTACSSGALEASHVLLAMGLSRQEAKSCLRVSMGWGNTEEEISFVLERIAFHVKRLQRL